MKAFVIKNKEGKYKSPHLDIREFCSVSIAEAAIWTKRKFAEFFCPKDCEVVEITIAEGDLEEENKQLEKQHDLLIDEFQEEREKLCKQIKQESDARERFVEKVKQLKKHLAEKDKEIEGTDSNLTYKQIQIDNLEKENKKLKEQLTQVRKQVCDEIRNVIKDCWVVEEYNREYGTLLSGRFNENKFYDLLNKIEQAKESLK